MSPMTKTPRKTRPRRSKPHQQPITTRRFAIAMWSVLPFSAWRRRGVRGRDLIVAQWMQHKKARN